MTNIARSTASSDVFAGISVHFNARENSYGLAIASPAVSMMSVGAVELSSDGDSDEALVDRARAGASDAFSALVARYRHRVYRLALRLSGNESDAEEIAQEAFLRAHRAIRAFKGQARFGTWLYRIAVNEALMQRRACKRRGRSAEQLRLRDESTHVHFAPPDADALIDSKLVVARVRDALGQLDEDHRSALVLRDLEELPAEVAAEMLGISAEAVRQRARRARLKMRELLSDLLGAANARDSVEWPRNKAEQS